MVVRTTDTNPAISTERIKEILLIEAEIDKHLLEHLISGKASYMINAPDREMVKLVMARYEKNGWSVRIGYEGAHLFRLDFEDIEQVEITRKILGIKPTKQSKV